MRHIRQVLAGLLLLAALLALAPAPASAAATFPDAIALPDGWRPEGVATGHGPVLYAGSLANGAIYAADLRTGQGAILVPGQPGRVAVGLSFDARTDAIFVAGGPTGRASVYAAATGALVREYTLTAPGTFVNDVIVTRDAAYFTNSALPEYYRVPLGPGGRLAAPDAVETIPLTGDWQQVPGFNANGIEATPSGEELIVVNSTTGTLYRVEPATGVATRIDLGGATVVNGDGLLLRGHALYVVRNQNNAIVVVDLARDLRSGAVVRTITDADFDVPTTVAAFGNALYVVNARFSTPPTPGTRVLRRARGGGEVGAVAASATPPVPDPGSTKPPAPHDEAPGASSMREGSQANRPPGRARTARKWHPRASRGAGRRAGRGGTPARPARAAEARPGTAARGPGAAGPGCSRRRTRSARGAGAPRRR